MVLLDRSIHPKELNWSRFRFVVLERKGDKGFSSNLNECFECVCDTTNYKPIPNEAINTFAYYSFAFSIPIYDCKYGQ